jgi:DNA-binding response OmpR family regulator
VIKAALDLGACRVVSKPFEVHELADLVTSALERARIASVSLMFPVS